MKLGFIAGNVFEWFVTFESSSKHEEIKAEKDKAYRLIWEWNSIFEMKICSIVELII